MPPELAAAVDHSLTANALLALALVALVAIGWRRRRPVNPMHQYAVAVFIGLGVVQMLSALLIRF